MLADKVHPPADQQLVHVSHLGQLLSSQHKHLSRCRGRGGRKRHTTVSLCTGVMVVQERTPFVTTTLAYSMSSQLLVRCCTHATTALHCLHALCTVYFCSAQCRQTVPLQCTATLCCCLQPTHLVGDFRIPCQHCCIRAIACTATLYCNTVDCTATLYCQAHHPPRQ